MAGSLMACSMQSANINTNKASASYSKESGTNAIYNGKNASGGISIKRNSSNAQ